QAAADRVGRLAQAFTGSKARPSAPALPSESRGRGRAFCRAEVEVDASKDFPKVLVGCCGQPHNTTRGVIMFKKSAHPKHRRGTERAQRGKPSVPQKLTAGLAALVLGAGVLPSALAPAALAAPVGQGLTLNAGDMRFILKQIKIAENHATKEDAEGTPLAGQPLLGSGPNHIANPLVPYGLRTVDGSDNKLVVDQGPYGQASLPFPRLAKPEWRNTTNGESYKSITSVTDADPRFISNVIVDQTSSNPAAIAAAGKAHRTVNDGPSAVPCDAAG